MIKINDNYSVTSDRYQWVLTEYRKGHDKDGNDKTHTKQTYHRTLEQVAKYVCEQSIKPCESFVDMMNTYRSTGETIAKLLSGAAR